MIPTYVVVPFKDEPETTANLFRALREQGEYTQILAYDNGSRDDTIRALHESVIADDQGLAIFCRPDAGIYEMWNEGWRRAVELANGPANVAILNNDITIPPNFLSTLAHHLRSNDDVWITYPDYDRAVRDGVSEELSIRPTQGTYQHGGMCGWAFMIKGESIDQGMKYVDEQFEWWYGDDDVVRNVTAAGKKVCRVAGLPLDHVNEKTASNGENEWTHTAKERDTARFHEKWK